MQSFTLAVAWAQWWCHRDTALLTAVRGSWGTTDAMQKNPDFIPSLFVKQVVLFDRKYSWSSKYLIVYPHCSSWR